VFLESCVLGLYPTAFAETDVLSVTFATLQSVPRYLVVIYLIPTGVRVLAPLAANQKWPQMLEVSDGLLLKAGLLWPAL
jgi:hypothetical protein